MNISIAVAATIADAIAARLVIMIDRVHIVIDDRYINLFFDTAIDMAAHMFLSTLKMDQKGQLAHKDLVQDKNKTHVT